MLYRALSHDLSLVDWAFGQGDSKKKPRIVRIPSFLASTPRNVGRRHRHTVVVQGLGAKPDFETNHVIWHMDHDAQTSTAFAYSGNESAEEHIYVPDLVHDSSDSGWIVGASLNFKTGNTFLNVFEAAHLQAGPIAQLHLSYAIPLGLHGDFVPT